MTSYDRCPSCENLELEVLVVPKLPDNAQFKTETKHSNSSSASQIVESGSYTAYDETCTFIGPRTHFEAWKLRKSVSWQHGEIPKFGCRRPEREVGMCLPRPLLPILADTQD